MTTPARIVSVGVVKDRDGGRYATLYVSRGLKSGKLDEIKLGEDELLRHISRCMNALASLRGVRTGL